MEVSLYELNSNIEAKKEVLNMNDYKNKLEELKNGTIQEIKVDKNEFYELRDELIKREDFKRFKGIAHQNGNIVYIYLEEERS